MRGRWHGARQRDVTEGAQGGVSKLRDKPAYPNALSFSISTGSMSSAGVKPKTRP